MAYLPPTAKEIWDTFVQTVRDLSTLIPCWSNFPGFVLNSVLFNLFRCFKYSITFWPFGLFNVILCLTEFTQGLPLSRFAFGTLTAVCDLRTQTSWKSRSLILRLSAWSQNSEENVFWADLSLFVLVCVCVCVCVCVLSGCGCSLVKLDLKAQPVRPN